jgi:ABC-type transport system involved in cytochrome c biogenesis permease component
LFHRSGRLEWRAKQKIEEPVDFFGNVISNIDEEVGPWKGVGYVLTKQILISTSLIACDSCFC